MFESVGNWLMLNEYPSYSYATNLVDEFYVDFYSYPPTFLFHDVLNPTEKLKKKMQLTCGFSLYRFAFSQGFPGGSDGKVSAFNAGDPGSIPGSGRFPWRRKWQSTPALLPRKSHGWRSLIGYSPWGRRESDTKNLSLSHVGTCMLE